MNHTNGDEAMLLSAAERGDESAFRVLYRRHTDRLRGVVLRLVAFDQDLAEDLIQETWIHAIRGMASFRRTASFETWLIAIGARRTYAYLRRRRRQSTLLSRQGPIASAVLPLPHAELVDVERALAALPDLEKAVLVLHVLEGHSHGEVAELLDIPEGTSRATLARARNQLRAQLVTEHDHA